MDTGRQAYPTGKNGEPRTLEEQTTDGVRKFSPSVGRNRDVVREALLDNLPASAEILEIGSGTGEHGIYVTEAAAEMQWTFTDHSQDALQGISAWIEYAARENLSGGLTSLMCPSQTGELMLKESNMMPFSRQMLSISHLFP